MNENKLNNFNLLQDVEHTSINKYIPSFTNILLLFLAFVCLVLFLPWIQTSYGIGSISTINPEDRLQPVVATINGRINKWFVHDGSFVHKGDNIIELIDLDPQNMDRIDNDILLNQNRVASLKIATDLSYKNYMRQSSLYKNGLTSLKDMEASQITYQKNLADLEYYKSLLIKLESGRSKQQTQLIKAIRDGFIVQTIASSSTDIVKSGDPLAYFIPDNINPAAEIYVSGNDIPLIKEGQKVRLVFDGWPSVQFSGWPSVAVGTVGGAVKVIDYAASKNGLFRVMIEQDPDGTPWPEDKFLRFGSKTEAYIQLGEVKLGYELWRQVNGFPIALDNQDSATKNGK